MISSGASIKAVQRQLGHASATMTLDLYGHLYDDDLDALADALDRKLAESLAPPVRPDRAPKGVGHVVSVPTPGRKHPSSGRGFAEGVGFEPTEPRKGLNSFQDCRLRPLGHPSRP